MFPREVSREPKFAEARMEGGNGTFMKLFRSGHFYIVIALFVALMPWRASASDATASEDSGSSVAADPKPAKAAKSSAIRSLKAEIEQLRKEDEIKRKMIEALAHRVDQLEAEQRQSEQKQEAQQKQREAQVETAVANQVQQQLSTSTMSGFMDQYFGQHRLVISGSAEGVFAYDRNSNINTFGAQVEPIFLYQMNDWIAFETEIEAKLPDDAESEFNLETGMAHIFLNDYLEVQAGKWLLPFGDFAENLFPFWVNKFVSRPLPFREGDDGALVPSADVGIQFRGAAQWGSEGQDIDYTLYVSNGPTFDTGLPQPVVGQAFSSPNNISLQSHSKAFGARVRVYPLPLEARMGRLELGASTYDGKWLDGLWFTSWGINAAYRLDELGLRGEFLQTHRQMPSGQNGDNRQGWYVQASYMLSRLHLDYLNRTELLVRYSGQNQRAIVVDEIGGVPGGDGGDVSASRFAPHAQEVALGLDYWISPSMVWKLEYDIELPRQGGYFVTFDDTGMPISSPARVPNDRAVMMQLAIGF